MILPPTRLMNAYSAAIPNTSRRCSSADEAWQKSVAESKSLDVFGAEGGPESRFYGALALEKLGRTSEAEKRSMSWSRAPPMRSPNLTSFNVAGLVERLRRHDDQARSDFERAVELDPAFWLARLEL